MVAGCLVEWVEKRWGSIILVVFVLINEYALCKNVLLL
jgi:hypothetical protein